MKEILEAIGVGTVLFLSGLAVIVLWAAVEVLRGGGGKGR